MRIPLACLLVIMAPVIGLAASASEASVSVAFVTSREDPHRGLYLDALVDTPEVKNVFLVDATRETEAQARKKLGGKLIAVYSSTGHLFAERKPDMVLISLEPSLATPAVAESLEAGCDVIVEKPAFLNVDVLSGLIAKADQKGLHIILSLANRTNPNYERARELIKENKLGRIYGVEMHLIADQTRLKKPAYQQSWFAHRSRSGGGHLAWLGIHWLDLAMYLTGSDIREIAGFTTNIGGQPIDVEDSAVLSMKFAGGFLGTMTSGYYLEKDYHSHLKIWGESGWIEINLFGGETPMRYYSTTDENPVVRTYDAPLRKESGYTLFLRECVQARLEHRAPPVSNRDTLRIVKTIRAAYEAVETGQTRKIEPSDE